MNLTRSEQLFAESQSLIPGGVNSPVRAFRSVGGTPPFIQRGAGSRIWDEDGNEYIDYVGSWGPLILGHANPAVVGAAQQACARGSSFGAPTRSELELAREIVDAVPSIDMVRLVSSGTEAVMSALRVARAFTGRDRIVKFEGCYHGHSDGLLARAGSGIATLGIPDTPGTPASFAAHTLTLPYNDIEAVTRLFGTEGPTIAAVIVEPIAGNMGVVPPAHGFLEALRRLTRDAGAVLILDEVITGFRVARGGAQEIYGIRPDLTVLGKIIGGGFPLAAYGGTREIMQLIAPAGPVYQAGTLSGNPVATAAGLATLRQLTADVYSQLEELGARLEQGLLTASASAGIPAAVHRVGSMLTLFFRESAPWNYTEVKQADAPTYARLHHALLKRGVYMAPSPFEAAFVSAAHTSAEIEATVRTAAESLLSADGR
jgi:glutamate-1-semialdehyde 2,1-aminomutase